MVGGDRKEEGGCYAKRGELSMGFRDREFQLQSKKQVYNIWRFPKGYWLCFTRAIFNMKVISGIVVEQRALSIHKCGLCL